MLTLDNRIQVTNKEVVLPMFNWCVCLRPKYKM